MKVLACNLLKYPNGDAGAIRAEKLAMMLKELGHDVLVVGLGYAPFYVQSVHNGISYISLRQKNGNICGKLLSHVLYWTRLKKLIGQYEPQAILMDDLGPLKTLRLKAFCRRRKIDLIHDSVEWYSPEQFRRGKLALGYMKKNILNQYLIDKSCKVIAISRYLQEHFLVRSKTCVRIPIVISEEDLCSEKRSCPGKVVFTYAGQPGKKDFLHVMLEAFLLLPKDVRENALFHIVGCTKAQMIASGIPEATLDKLQDTVMVHGRVSHDAVLEILKETDFTLLVRAPEQRYAKAGFPTKVVESLANGTPVLCNLSSDLCDYLRDGENALLAESNRPEDVAHALRRALALTEPEREVMRGCALESAKKYFDYRNYLSVLGELLENA